MRENSWAYQATQNPWNCVCRESHIPTPRSTSLAPSPVWAWDSQGWAAGCPWSKEGHSPQLHPDRYTGTCSCFGKSLHSCTPFLQTHRWLPLELWGETMWERLSFSSHTQDTLGSTAEKVSWLLFSVAHLCRLLCVCWWGHRSHSRGLCVSHRRPSQCTVPPSVWNTPCSSRSRPAPGSLPEHTEGERRGTDTGRCTPDLQPEVNIIGWGSSPHAASQLQLHIQHSEDKLSLKVRAYVRVNLKELPV